MFKLLKSTKCLSNFFLNIEGVSNLDCTFGLILSKFKFLILSLNGFMAIKLKKIIN